MKRFLGLFLATVMALGGAVSAFAASSDSLDLPGGGIMEAECGRYRNEAYASTIVNGNGSKPSNIKSTVEVANYDTGASMGKKTASGSSKFTIYRAAVAVPSGTTITVYGAHQATISGKTYGLYTQDIGV